MLSFRSAGEGCVHGRSEASVANNAIKSERGVIVDIIRLRGTQSGFVTFCEGRMPSSAQFWQTLPRRVIEDSKAQ